MFWVGFLSGFSAIIVLEFIGILIYGIKRGIR